jgi:hypothetical protein
MQPAQKSRETKFGENGENGEIDKVEKFIVFHWQALELLPRGRSQETQGTCLTLLVPLQKNRTDTRIKMEEIIVKVEKVKKMEKIIVKMEKNLVSIGGWGGLLEEVICRWGGGISGQFSADFTLMSVYDARTASGDGKPGKQAGAASCESGRSSLEGGGDQQAGFKCLSLCQHSNTHAQETRVPLATELTAGE